jgi:hypothetical protein
MTFIEERMLEVANEVVAEWVRAIGGIETPGSDGAPPVRRHCTVSVAQNGDAITFTINAAGADPAWIEEQKNRLNETYIARLKTAFAR